MQDRTDALPPGLMSDGPKVIYVPDPKEEAWFASPEGRRNSAKLLLLHAAETLAKAAALTREAEEMEAARDAR